MGDADTYASGNWFVTAGKEDEFLARWREFLEWTRDSASGFQRAFLLRGKSNPRHFVSLSHWGDAASEERWRTLPEFMQKFGACRALCDDMQSDDYERVITIS